jgi:hypothetical protein
VAIGNSAGSVGQISGSIAIGFEAGNTGQGLSAVAIGQRAGFTGQGTGSICIGRGSGASGAASDSIALGSNSFAGATAIVVGSNTRFESTAVPGAMKYGIMVCVGSTGSTFSSNSAVASNLSPTSASGGCMIYPIRGLVGPYTPTQKFLMYDTATFEVFYSSDVAPPA